MKFETIENIIVWQKAKTLTLQAYEALHDTQDNIIKTNLLQTCLLIVNTIAQGYEKTGKKDLIDDLYLAKRSCGPCRSLIHIALETGMLDVTHHHALIDASMDVTKLLAGFIKKLKEVKAPQEG